jgi:hypothetical protein
MKLLKQALAVLGSVVVIAIIAALVTPKTAHALVATAVEVVNTASQPVPTQPVHARQAVYLACQLTVTSTTAGACTLNDNTTHSPYTVPLGKRLVFDSVTGYVFVTNGQGRPVYAEIFPNSGGDDRFFLAPTFTATNNAIDTYVFGQNATAYSDPGSQIAYEFVVNSRSDYLSGSLEIYGHTEDIQ